MSSHQRPQRNILFIVVDQWRYDRIGLPDDMVPNLKALAADGVSFSNHFGQITPCAPSRASLYTGLYPMTHRVLVNGSPLAREHTTIAQRLRRHGYRPTLFGYTDTATDPRELAPNDPALTDYEGVLPGLDIGLLLTENQVPWMAELKRRGYDFETVADIFVPDRSKPNANGGVAGHPARFAAEDSDTAFLTDHLIGWLGTQDPGWCAMVSYIRPHDPYVPAAPYHGIVDPFSLPPPTRAASWQEEASVHPFMRVQLDHAPASYAYQGLTGLVRDIEEKDWRSVRAAYAGLMVEVDHHIGRVIDHLKQTGQYDNTLIVFTADHGEQMFDHYLINQNAHYDAGLHLPLILRDPDAAARRQDGTTVEKFSESVDLVPTLLDWLGEEAPPELDGATLLPFLRGETPENWRHAVLWEYHYRSSHGAPFGAELGLQEDELMMSVIRDKDFKHVFFPGLPTILIDLRNDPEELHNLANDPAFAAIERDYLAEQLRMRILHADRRLSTMRLTPSGPRTDDGPRRTFHLIRRTGQ